MPTFRIGYRIDGGRQTRIVYAADVSAAIDKAGIYKLGGAKLSSVSIQCAGTRPDGEPCQRFTGDLYCCKAHTPDDDDGQDRDSYTDTQDRESYTVDDE